MIGKDIQKAVKILKNGELVAIPTETVYGLAANALCAKSVSQIFRAKKRPTFDPLIIHSDSIEKLKKHIAYFPPKAEKLANHFWAGALTLVLEKKDSIPDLVTSGLSSVAVRIPNHPLTLELLRNLDFPLAAPSANPFGYISPTSAQHVETMLGNEIPYVLDGGICDLGIESTIVSFEKGEAIILRKGAISIEKIEKLIGKVTVKLHSSSSPKAPGMLKSHYAPKIPLFIANQNQSIKELIKQHEGKKIGILSFEKEFPEIEAEKQRILSPKGDFSEAAHNLFAYLRELDAMNLDVILSELLPEKDLGRAINDRITRASTR